MIEALPAHIAELQFGMGREEYAALIRACSDVYNFAAKIAFWDDYAESARVNVESTREVLLFCARSTPAKTLHHCSTLSVFGDMRGKAISERTPIGACAKFAPVLSSEGYSQSKWVSEKLVFAASAAWGVPVRVYRLGFVGFHQVTGVSNPEDWVTRLVRGIAQAQSAPPTFGATRGVVAAPVNYIAEAYLELSKRVDTGQLTIYHLCSQSPTSLAQIVQAVERGISSMIPCADSHKAWCEDIRSAGSGNALYTLLPFLEGGFPLPQRFMDTLTQMECPALNDSELDKYVGWLFSHGLLKQ